MSYLDHTNLRQFVSNFKNYIISRINGKAEAVHTHSASEITSGTFNASAIPNLDASKITTGVIDIDRLPQGALERLVTVANQTARFALTSTDVQLGDTVKQTDTGVMYIVTDTANLANDNGYTEYTAGSATSVPWSGVTGKPAFANVATSGSYNDLTDKPTIPTVPTNYVTTDTTQTVSGQKTWTDIQTYNEMVVYSHSSDVVEQSRQKLPKDVSTSTDPMARFSTLVDSAGHNVVVTAEGHWETYVSKSVSLKYKNDSTKAGTVDFRLGSNGKGIFYPQSPFECSLGNSANQWSSVYAQTYYYNGTEFQNKFVTVDTNQTITGTKIFTSGTCVFESANANLMFRSTAAVIGSTTASSNWMFWQDKNYVQTAYISRDFWNDGSDGMRIAIIGKRDNGAPSTSGTDIDCGVNLNILADGTRAFTPNGNNTVNLGISTNQWASVYAQTYYYNGTAWGLDKANVWTNANHFTGGAYNNSVMLVNSTLDLSQGNSSITETNQSMICLVDSSKQRAYSRFQSWTAADQTVTVIGSTYKPDANSETDFSVWVSNKPNDTTLHPYGVTNPNLGNSTYKWKSLNGVNPGALSFPNLASAIDIASSITNTAGGDNFYTAPADGLVSVVILGTSNLMVFAPSGNRFYYGTQSMTPDNEGNTWCSIPVPTGYRVRIRVNGSIVGAAFYPCLGNV